MNELIKPLLPQGGICFTLMGTTINITTTKHRINLKIKSKK